MYRCYKQHPGGKWNDLSLQMFQLLISHFKLFFLSIWLVVNCHIFYIFTKCIFMSVFLRNAGLFGQRRKIPQFCCKPFSCALNEIVLNILKPHFCNNCFPLIPQYYIGLKCPKSSAFSGPTSKTMLFVLFRIWEGSSEKMSHWLVHLGDHTASSLESFHSKKWTHASTWEWLISKSFLCPFSRKLKLL